MNGEPACCSLPFARAEATESLVEGICAGSQAWHWHILALYCKKSIEFVQNVQTTNGAQAVCDHASRVTQHVCIACKVASSTSGGQVQGKCSQDGSRMLAVLVEL